MYVVVTEQIYDLILSQFGSDYVYYDDETSEYCVYYQDLIDNDYAYQEGDAIYLYSLRPSEKGVYVGEII